MEKNDKKTNDVQSQNEIHLSLALEAGQMGTWQVDLNTLELSGSRTLLDIHGLKELPSNLSHAINETVHPEDRAELSRILFGTVTNHAPFVHQYRIIRPDGALRWLEGRGKTNYNAEGKPTILVGIVMDITERKKGEIELKHSQEELTDFFMQAPMPMVVLSGPDHKYVLANAPYERMVGRAVLGKTVSEAFSNEEVGTFIPLLDGVYQTGVPYRGRELSLRIPDEHGELSEHWLNVDYYPSRDAHGHIKGVIAVHQDITEEVLARNKAEDVTKTLAIERHKFETIFKESPVAMCLLRGKEMVFEKVNPKFESIFEGRTLLERKLLDVFPEIAGQRFPDLLDKVFETGEPYYGHEELGQIVHKNDGLLHDHYFDYNYIRINDVHGEPYGVFDLFVDVTDKVLARKALEESKLELERTVANLEQEREIRERFVATLSHDLRNPLSATRISAEVLSSQRENPESFEKTISRIMHSVDEMDEMIRNLLDANRISAGEKLPLKIGECEINETIRRTLDDLSIVYGNRFVFQNNPEPIVGYWDKSAIKRVIENLCSNAVKYGSPKEITVKVSLSTDAVEIDISVQNWGTPIPREDLDTLFEYFKRRKIAQIEGHVGWGIGLTIVRGLAEAHGGVALVESTEEAGTIFKVILPRDSREKVASA